MIHSRYVLSQDGTKHYISTGQLIKLWKILSELCSTAEDFSYTLMLGDSRVAFIEKNILHLFPDPSGEYRLTLEQEIFKQKHLSLLLP